MKKKINVVAGVILKNKMILIAQRNSKDKYAFKWEFPGGKIEEGENPCNCLRRELMEELSIDVEVGRQIIKVNYSYPEFDINMICYMINSFNGEPKNIVHEKIVWEYIDRLKEYDFLPADIPLVDLLINDKKLFL
jgi:mutator protein MutT